MKCCICKKEISGRGNNPYPIAITNGMEAGCCDSCDKNIVWRARELGLAYSCNDCHQIEPHTFNIMDKNTFVCTNPKSLRYMMPVNADYICARNQLELLDSE